jgi:tripartite ATP-independent transporter DctP family solute receptor
MVDNNGMSFQYKKISNKIIWIKNLDLQRGIVMLKMLTSTALGAVIAMSMQLSAHAAETLRIAHASPDQSLINEAMLKFKADIEARTNSDIVVEIYPNALLGDEGPIAEAVGAGSIDMGLGGVVDAIDPRLSVISLPFLFKDFANVHNVLDSQFGQDLFKLAEPKGYKIVGVLDSGFRSFTNNVRAINTPEDFKGLKLRVPPIPVALETVKAFGALPQTVPYGETYMALQSGAVDGAEPELRDFADAKWFEVQKHLSVSNYMWMANYWFMNGERFNSLSPEQQKAVSEVATDVQNWYRAQLNTVYDKILADVQTAGVAVNTVDTTKFVEFAEPVYEIFSKEYGADLVKAARDAASANQ